MVEERVCGACGAPMGTLVAARGRLRRYCDLRCRRRQEYRRRRWERMAEWIRACDLNAAWEGLTPAQRAAHRQRGEALRLEAGPRP